MRRGVKSLAGCASISVRASESGSPGSFTISEQWKERVVERACSDGSKHFRIARRIVGDAAAAEDVCQQVYLKALNAREDIRDPHRLPAWLTRVIVNESLDLLRQRKRQRKAYEQRVESDRSALTSSPAESSVEMREHVALLLERLDEPIRTVVVMRTMQGMSGNEVKRALGCSAGLVSRRLHQGLEQLRQWMAESPDIGETER